MYVNTVEYKSHRHVQDHTSLLIAENGGHVLHGQQNKTHVGPFLGCT